MIGDYSCISDIKIYIKNFLNIIIFIDYKNLINFYIKKQIN